MVKALAKPGAGCQVKSAWVSEGCLKEYGCRGLPGLQTLVSLLLLEPESHHFLLLLSKIVIFALVMKADRNINITKWLQGLGNLAHVSFWPELDCNLEE